MRLQHTLAVSAHLAGGHRAGRTIPLAPLHHRGYRNVEPRRHRAAALATSNRCHNARPQIVGKGSGHQMLASYPASILNHKPPSQGIPSRFTQSVNRSRMWLPDITNGSLTPPETSQRTYFDAPRRLGPAHLFKTWL